MIPATNHIDLAGKQLLNAALHPISAPPAQPVEGQIWFNTSAGRFQTYHAGAVVDMANVDDITTADLSGLATETYADNAATVAAAAAVAAAVDSAPATLDTLNELAAALGDDGDFANTVNTALAARTRKFAANIGDGNATTIAVAHDLGTDDVTVSLRYAAGTKAFVLFDAVATDINTVTFEFATPPAANEFRAVVVG